MKVKDLLKLLEGVDPESDVLICDNGSILATDNVNEHNDYNHDPERGFYIVAKEWE